MSGRKKFLKKFMKILRAGDVSVLMPPSKSEIKTIKKLKIMSKLVSIAKINEMFGPDMKVEDISGTVDGSSFNALVTGDSVKCTNKPVSQGGNFICKKGVRNIDGRNVTVETHAWVTEQGRILHIGSLYKKNELGAENPANVGVIAGVAKAELVPQYFGKTITVGASEEITVKLYRPDAEGNTTAKATRFAFTVTPTV
jgi:hypothetical protein